MILPPPPRERHKVDWLSSEHQQAERADGVRRRLRAIATFKAAEARLREERQRLDLFNCLDRRHLRTPSSIVVGYEGPHCPTCQRPFY